MFLNLRSIPLVATGAVAVAASGTEVVAAVASPSTGGMIDVVATDARPSTGGMIDVVATDAGAVGGEDAAATDAVGRATRVGVILLLTVVRRALIGADVDAGLGASLYIRQ